ncbi:transposable element Tcb2 transposase [Trichonephila clavipes]|nr:transposable element Tcb2 transposase [Trichonephila clavipes]
MPFEFKRSQFPVRLAYAMTINKAQGQSLQVCGLNLENPCFSRGQADWNPGKHNVVSRTLLESPEVLLQGCGIDSKTGNVRRRPGAGQPRATTSTDDRYIQLTTRRNRTENATQLQRQLLLATGRRVSSQTVRNRLREGGLYARRPMVCIPLTPRHHATRRNGLLNIEIRSNMIGAKCCLQTSPDSV